MDATERDRKLFSYEEALSTFPDVRRRTEAAVRQLEAVYSEYRSREEGKAQRGTLEEAAQGVIDRWRHDIQARGCAAKGLWLVDWDTGEGYFCWKYPEETLAHFHSYEDGFEGRIPVQ